MRALVLACAPLVAAFGGGCAVTVDGSFDDVSFQPATTAVAILDAHDILERDGALVPVERPDSDKRVHVWLSGADVPDEEDWQHIEDDRLLELKKELARNDLLVLRDLPYDALEDGRDVSASVDASGADGDFAVFLSQRRPSPGDLDRVVENGLGGRVFVTVKPGRVEKNDPRGGTFEAEIEVERKRDVSQPANDLATGKVTLRVSLAFAPERLAEANFAVVAPIAACGAERGPGKNAGCDAVDREPIVDATGAH